MISRYVCGRSQTLAAAGLGLPEALVALALLGVALSGLVAAQWQARGLQQDALQRQQALLMLADFSARRQLNPEAHAVYALSLTGAVPVVSSPDTCAVAACVPAERARADVHFLAGEMRRLLPQPAWRLEPCLDSPGQCLLLAWGGTLASSGPDGGCLDASGLRQTGAHCVAQELP